MHQVLRLGRQVAEGLAEAHRTGLVHRDLKTENIMVTSPGDDPPKHSLAGRDSASRAKVGCATAGRAKILDFGLVKNVPLPSSDQTLPADFSDSASLTGMGAVLGTARSMSPE